MMQLVGFRRSYWWPGKFFVELYTPASIPMSIQGLTSSTSKVGLDKTVPAKATSVLPIRPVMSFTY